MQIVPKVFLHSRLMSQSNIFNRNYPPISISITYSPISVRSTSVLENVQSSLSGVNYFLNSTNHVEGVLKNDNKEVVPYSPVFLYNTTSGVLLKKTFTDVNGYYRFDYLRAKQSYMIMSYDKTYQKNATVIEFTLKEENI